MEMFGMLESIAKAALAVVTVPVSVAADVATLGGSLTDRKETYTGEALSDLIENLKRATNPND